MSRSSKGTKGKPTATLEDDELFKAIGGQLDINFDYSQWQRAEGGQSAQGGILKGTKARKNAGTPATTRTGFTVSTAVTGAGSYADHSCRNERKQKKESSMQKKDREKKEEHLKIQQLRIRNRKQTIEDYKNRKERLLEENLKLKMEIEGLEKSSHDTVKKLLRKYERFRGGVTTLNDNFMKDLLDAQVDRDKTEAKIEKDLAALEVQVDNLDKKLREKQLELHILLNYKDKEYPVKSLRITELQKQIEELKLVHAEEEQELQHVIDSEIEKFKKEGMQHNTKLNDEVLQKVVAKMHPSLKDMAAQNCVMTKEIEFHTKQIEEVTEINIALDKEVKALMRSPKTDIRQQLFPEFYPEREKCTPDMDIVLDIPTQEWLPI